MRHQLCLCTPLREARTLSPPTGQIANTPVHYHMEIMGETDEDLRNPIYEKLALRNYEDATRMANMRASLATKSPIEE